MKSSAEYSTSSTDSMRVRRGVELPVPVRLLQRGDLVAHDLPALLLGLEQQADLLRAGPPLLELRPDRQDLEAREPVQLQLEDRVGLLGVQVEPRHDLLRGVLLAVGLADDADDLVEDVEDLLEAFEDVDPPAERGQLVLQPARHHFEAEVQEVPEDRLEVEPLGLAELGVLRRHEAGEVHREGGLERRVLAQVRHHHLLVGVLLQLQLDPHIVGRHVPARRGAAAACGR